MSYEGYDKWLCADGHEHTADTLDSPLGGHTTVGSATWRCDNVDKGKNEICGKHMVWYTCVDQTNCERDEETGLEPGDVVLEILEEAVYETCNLGHQHLVKEERFKIPSVGGHRL